MTRQNMDSAEFSAMTLSRWQGRLAMATASLFVGLMCGCVAETSKTTPAPLPEVKKPPYVSLSLDDFDQYQGKPRKGVTIPPGEKTWTERNGVIVCTGRPRGYIYTKNEYRDFEVEFEYRFVNPPTSGEGLEKLNTGCLLYIQGEHRIWPDCLEVQGKYLEMAEIKSNKRGLIIRPDLLQDERREARLGLESKDAWNRLTIRGRNGSVHVLLNGESVSSCPATELVSGRIGFQSEGWPVEFRNIRIRDYAAGGASSKTGKTAGKKMSAD